MGKRRVTVKKVGRAPSSWKSSIVSLVNTIPTIKEFKISSNSKLADILSIENHHISLPDACVLDYYVAGFWYPL